MTIDTVRKKYLDSFLNSSVMDKGTFQVYKSSAGSGKTYTLVKEYLKIVLPQPEKMRQILAITFTNAAAAEMKSRIIEELGQIASLAQTPGNKKARNLLNEILEGIKEEGKATPSVKLLIANAQKVLTEILHNYSDFSVSTIDSFVHRIVRTFAFDLRIPVNFEIELDADSLLTKAVDMLISRAGSDEKLTELLVRFILNQADEDKDLRIEAAIGKLAKTLMDEDSTPFIEKLKDLTLDEFLVIQRNIKVKIRAFENKAQNHAIDAINLIDSENLSQESFYYGSRGIYAYFRKLFQGDVSGIMPNTSVKKTLNDDKWYGGKVTPADKFAIDSIKGQLVQTIEDILGQSNQYLENYQLLRAVNQNLFPLGVLNEVQRILEEIKTENVLLHISDFNRKISAIVAEQPVPFIYERIGERYQHYMIDEFQDTSMLQWQNLLPLVENGLATGNLSLVVGDGKQAIYRWRNGDVEQFIKLPELPEGVRGLSKDQWQATLQRNYHQENLATNWRSRKVIVDFNNRFFEMAKDSLSGEMQQIYLDQAQNWRKDADGGYVEISFLEKTEELSYEEVTLEKVRLAIERLLEAGHPYSDITILCRSNNKGSLLARYLLRHQIPVISSDSLLLNQSEEVIFFTSILKLLANRFDALSAIEMINYLLSAGFFKEKRNLQDVLSGLGLFPLPSSYQRLDWQTTIDKVLANEGIAFRFASLAYLNLFDVCETITRHFFATGEPNPFVAFFMDAVFEYSEKNSLSNSDFLQWWEESGKDFSLVVPQGLNAIQIMTIHKSKGLQFPVVIFAFADLGADKATKKGCWVSPDEKIIEGLGAIWLKMGKSSLENTPYFPLYESEMERSALDMLNLAYVAMTRPKEKLFLLTKNPGANTPSKPKLQHFFSEYLKQHQLWQEEQNDYAFGSFEQTGQEKVPLSHADPVFRRLLSRSWTGALRMRSNQQEWGLASAGQRERGKLLHRAMEQIITTNDITPVLARMRADGEIDQPTELEWTQRIKELIRLELLKPCFEPSAIIKTEAGLFDQNGNFYRPDRVVLLKEKTVVIDYKTGREYDSHREQIETYAKLLESMGYPAVEKMLLYLDEYKLKTV